MAETRSPLVSSLSLPLSSAAPPYIDDNDVQLPISVTSIAGRLGWRRRRACVRSLSSVTSCVRSRQFIIKAGDDGGDAMMVMEEVGEEGDDDGNEVGKEGDDDGVAHHHVGDDAGEEGDEGVARSEGGQDGEEEEEEEAGGAASKFDGLEGDDGEGEGEDARDGRATMALERT